MPMRQDGNVEAALIPDAQYFVNHSTAGAVNTILVGTGDNFAPNYYSRVFANVHSTVYGPHNGTDYGPQNGKELYSWQSKEWKWISDPTLTFPGQRGHDSD